MTALELRGTPIMLCITRLMQDLARDRPVFHSEADFQHALAWRIHNSIPDGEVRLEYKPCPDKRMYLDLWLPKIRFAVELKYRTRELTLTHKGESFALRNQSAQDIGRYNFLKDIRRLERLHERAVAQAGLAILLTNDHLYWTDSKVATNDAAFRIHQCRRIAKREKMAWAKDAAPGAIKGHEAPIRLKHSYHLCWRDYAEAGDGKHHQFRYLAVKVPVALSFSPA